MKPFLTTAFLLFSIGSACAQAPTVTATLPAVNASGVNRATNVTVTFSQPINPATAAGVKVFSSCRGGQLAGAATVAGNVLTFDPTRDFRVGEVVSVSATRAVQGAGGAPAAPRVVQFRVGVVGGTGVLGNLSQTAVGPAPWGLTTADVDGDGDLDALVPNNRGGTVSVRLNNGLGTFGGTDEVPVGLGPKRVVAADVDGDGDLDFVCANANDNTVSVRTNNGLGGFGNSQEVVVDNNPQDVAVGDVDGDGDLDLLTVTNAVPSPLTVRLNNGAGVFAGGTTLLNGFYLSQLALADVDGDGDLDALCGSEALSGVGTGIIRMALNNGAGVFVAGSTVATAVEAEVLAVGDVDNDGDVDVVSAGIYGNRASVRLNNGAGTFGGTQVVTLATTSGVVALADMDGDGDLDLVESSPFVTLHRNDGSGTFGAGTATPIINTRRSLALADVDGDGDLDVLAGVPTSDLLMVALNNGTGAPLATAAAQHGATLQAWPVPSCGVLNVRGAGSRAEITVFDGQGRRVLLTTADAQGDATLRLPANVGAGLYMLRTGQRQQKFLVE